MKSAITIILSIMCFVSCVVKDGEITPGPGHIYMIENGEVVDIHGETIELPTSENGSHLLLLSTSDRGLGISTPDSRTSEALKNGMLILKPGLSILEYKGTMDDKGKTMYQYDLEINVSLESSGKWLLRVSPIDDYHDTAQFYVKRNPA